MIELRPAWCHPAATPPNGLAPSPWIIGGVDAALGSDEATDNWDPDQGLVVRRTVTVDPGKIRSDLGIDCPLGVAASWHCTSAGSAGTHDGGPLPVPVDGLATVELTVRLNGAVGGTVTLDTCLLLQDEDRGLGKLAWSDQWETVRETADATTVILEGDEDRLRVLPVDLGAQISGASGALWHVDVRADAEPDDPLPSAATILLNEPQVTKRHGGLDGLPDDLVAVMRTDLLHALLVAHLPHHDAREYPNGSLGHMLDVVAGNVAGSVDAALALLESRPEELRTRLRAAYWDVA